VGLRDWVWVVCLSTERCCSNLSLRCSSACFLVLRLERTITRMMEMMIMIMKAIIIKPVVEVRNFVKDEEEDVGAGVVEVPQVWEMVIPEPRVLCTAEIAIFD